MIPTLPREARNRLAELIIAALSDDAARVALRTLANAASIPAEWLDPDDRAHAPAFIARVRQAVGALASAPRLPRPLTVADALDAAACLFDAGLYFETHEVLEPSWREAHGELREMLQGLIQIAVGSQHLANGNRAGAYALLHEGAERLRRIGDEDVGPTTLGGRAVVPSRESSRFVAGVTAWLDDLDPRRRSAPSFPRLDRS